MKFPVHMSNSLPVGNEDHRAFRRHRPPPGPALGRPDDRLRRAIQYSEIDVVDRDASAYWVPRLRGGMTTKRVPAAERVAATAAGRTLAFSRHELSELFESNHPLEGRGRREDRVSADTRGPRAAKSTRQNHRFSPITGLPCAMALRLIRALPRDRLSCPCLCTTLASARHQHRDARTTRLHRPARIVRPRDMRAAIPTGHRIPPRVS
jgi:hypothetical protein